MTSSTRKDAIAAGLKHFFTGRPCKRGHVSTRFVSDKKCTECNKEKASERYARKNPIRQKFPATRERIAAQQKHWKDKNHEHMKEYSATRRAANPCAARFMTLRWKRNNPDKNCELANRYRARKLNQICACCAPSEILAVYTARPVGMHIDHNVALCLGGLHCAHNLQYLTPRAHQRKTCDDLSKLYALRRAA